MSSKPSARPPAVLLGILLLCLTHCAQPQDLNGTNIQLKDLQSRLDTQEHEIRYIKTLEGEMREGLSLALCRPEILQLMEDVQRECSLPDPSHSNAPGICETKKIHPAVISADPEHKGRFLKFMTHLRHEVFYLRRGASEIVKFRHERLSRLVGHTLLKRTRFLVVAHPVAGEPNANVEAQHRADVVAEMLRRYNPEISEARVIVWIYAFPVSKSEIDYPADRPAPGEPGDLNRSVWVFRADC